MTEESHHRHTEPSGLNERSLGQGLRCPRCGSRRLYKDGMRRTADASGVQRWLCRACGYRFSQRKPLQERLGWQINSAGTIVSDSQVCELLTEESKNLTIGSKPLETGLAGATKTSTGNIPGKIVEYSFWLLKQEYAKTTIESRTKLMKRLTKLGANILDPESVKETIAKQTWSEGRKELAVETYSNFLRMTGGTWQPPTSKKPLN